MDISDPAGHIVLRGKSTVPGTIRNRFFLDDFNNVLRVSTKRRAAVALIGDISKGFVAVIVNDRATGSEKGSEPAA